MMMLMKMKMKMEDRKKKEYGTMITLIEIPLLRTYLEASRVVLLLAKVDHGVSDDL